MANPWDNDPVVAVPAQAGAAMPWDQDPVSEQQLPPKTGEELRKRIYADLDAKREAAKPKPHAPYDTGGQKADFASVYTDDMLFGLPGKAASGMSALIRAPFTDKSVGEEYSAIRGQYQNAREKYKEEHPTANAAASIGGAVHGGATVNRLAGSAASAVAPRLVQALNGSYLGRMAGDAVSGAAQGALSAYGHDEDIGTGAMIGGGAGLAARPVTSVVGGTVSAVGSMLGIGNTTRAQNAVAEALRRSGQSANDVADDMARAAQQGQPEYMVADSLGNSGQRMLTGIARSPGDMRQQIAEQLQRRQAGQGRRLSAALSEGFNAPRTAEQTKSALEAARDTEADRAYEMARYGLTPEDFDNAVVPQGNIRDYLETLPKPRVDVRPVVAAIDDRIGGMQGSGVTGDSIDSALTGFRNRLSAPAENLPEGVHAMDLSDFDRVLGVKKDLRDAIEVARRAGQGNRVRELNKVHAVLDKALEDASPAYRQANDRFAQASRNIEAVDQGSAAAMRGRVEDTIPAFRGMTQEQQAAYRSGYADPYIADVQKTPGPMTNKARPLISDATQAEFPAFAAPGQGPQLMERIGREQRMFETANQALGGSHTADNMADAAEMAGFDPTLLGIAGNALTGNFRSAGMQALQSGVNAIQGRNQGTRDMIARMLLQSEPTQARAELAAAVRKGETLTRAQQAIVNALIGAGSTAYSR